LPLPLVVLNDNQERLSEAVHEILELILRFSPPPPLLKFRVPGVALNWTAAPDWETDTVTLETPGPLSVMDPLRALVEVFASAVTTTTPLPCDASSVTQGIFSLIDQFTFDETVRF
jgi:hypothetical protein